MGAARPGRGAQTGLRAGSPASTRGPVRPTSPCPWRPCFPASSQRRRNPVEPRLLSVSAQLGVYCGGGGAQDSGRAPRSLPTAAGCWRSTCPAGPGPETGPLVVPLLSTLIPGLGAPAGRVTRRGAGPTWELGGPPSWGCQPSVRIPFPYTQHSCLKPTLGHRGGCPHRPHLQGTWPRRRSLGDPSWA